MPTRRGPGNEWQWWRSVSHFAEYFPVNFIWGDFMKSALRAPPLPLTETGTQVQWRSYRSGIRRQPPTGVCLLLRGWAEIGEDR